MCALVFCVCEDSMVTADLIAPSAGEMITTKWCLNLKVDQGIRGLASCFKMHKMICVSTFKLI